MLTTTMPPTLRWTGALDGHLQLIDQTRLPGRLALIDCQTPEEVWQAIRRLSVRGAPAIGIAAAYGVCLATSAAAISGGDPAAVRAAAQAAADHLATSRPTAVNLFWALDRMRLAAEQAASDGRELAEQLLATAREIHEEDRRRCYAIGRHGAPLLKGCRGVLTHCNAGALATSEFGTALAVIYTAHDGGQSLRVYADETRPLLQGARLTAWELQQHGVPTTVLCDSMAAVVMRERRVDAVVVGADRIAANGDVANKIGTYGLAILARHHRIPFYVAAPGSTFDLQLASGDAIPIEERAAEEVAGPPERRTVPQGVEVFNPAFDVTPAELITALITDHGVIRPVEEEPIRQVLRAEAPPPSVP